MHTKDKLAEALRSIGLAAMADKAETGYYHDYLSPLAMPEFQLLEDLTDAARRDEGKRKEILALRTRHMEGEFDANAEESEAWMDSPEGQATMRMLTRGRAE